MNFLMVLISAVVLIAVAFAGFAINILVRKGGKFPNTHVSGNKYLKSQGISCAQTYDREELAKSRQKIDYNSLKVSSGSN